MMPPVVDPGSLDRLHDIVQPPPVPWWPLAPGWYWLAAGLVMLCGSLGSLAWLRHAQNRYRREGLSELARIAATNSSANTLPALAELLKRVALVAYPRTQVASLSGLAWLQFLDKTGRTIDFTTGPGVVLATEYSPDVPDASLELIAAIRHWIKHHRTDLPC